MRLNQKKIIFKKIKMPAGRRYPVKRNMKKNNRRKPVRKKNAYKPSQKKATARMLQPLAEGRKMSFINDSQLTKIVGPTSHEGWQVFIPESWNMMFRESFLETLPNAPTSSGFSGNTLFSRFLTQQIRIKMNQIYHIGVPPQFHVVWGWSKLPYITAPQSAGTGQTNANNVLITHNRTEQIASSLAQMYNQMFPTTNRKQFALKYNKMFQVNGLAVNSPNMNNSQLRRDLVYRLKWAPNTKYHMRPATSGNGTAGMPAVDITPDAGNTYTPFGPIPPTDDMAYWTPSSKNNGDLWTPFFAIQLRNPDVFGLNKEGGVDTNAYPVLYQKNTHYFYDL